MKKFVGLLILILFFLLGPKTVLAKDYYFPKVEGDYSLNKDGSVNVLERRTYSFDGDFSWAEIKIPLTVSKKGYKYSARIEDFQVSEAENILYKGTNQTGGVFTARWTYSAYNENRTFDISYKLKNAIGGGKDFSEFYWQIIGDEWEKRTDRAEFLVTYPPEIPQNQVYAFAHGPLNGKYDFVSGNSVRFTAGDVPPKQFVEVRLVFPPGYFQGAVNSDKNLEQVLKEEKEYKSSDYYKNILLAVVLVITLAWAVYWTYAWFKHGKEYKAGNIPKYLHHPPSKLQPALVELLLSQGNKITVKTFGATLFDLAHRKYLILTERRVLKHFLIHSYTQHEYGIVIRKSLVEIDKDKNLKEFEKMLLNQIYLYYEKPSDEEITSFALRKTDFIIKLDNLKSNMKQAAFREFWLEWEKEIKKEGEKLGFLEQGSVTKHNFFWISFAVLLVLNILVLSFSTSGRFFGLAYLPFFSAGLLWPFIYLFFIVIRLKRFTPTRVFSFMKRWSFAWGPEAKKWQAFNNFLNDFSHFKSTLPQQLPIWEEYLVYGILFGLTEKILKLMPLILGEQVPTWYVTSGGSGTSTSFSSFTSGLNSFSSGFSTGATAGSGGGFSSGGGGGGGGGGGSAG